MPGSVLPDFYTSHYVARFAPQFIALRQAGFRDADHIIVGFGGTSASRTTPIITGASEAASSYPRALAFGVLARP